MSDEEKIQGEKQTELLKPDFLDYIALTIALLQTTLLPFLFVGLALVVIYLTMLTITIAGPIWLVAVYVPLTALLILIRRVIHWRRLEKAKASLR